jgi:23S rRNA pseudouridine2605 synthase
MRLNKFIASATGKSRREADVLIEAGRVKVDGRAARLGQVINQSTVITLDDKELSLPTEHTLIMLNKPIGYVSSRRAQTKNAKTLYELLPPKLHKLKTIGRLDRDSSGLILLTDDGDFAHQMTHPKFAKVKIYEISLDKPLQPLHQQMITDFGIALPDGKSRLELEKSPNRRHWRVTMHEGRNRQIRRTFAALGYTVIRLRRTDFGDYHLDDLPTGQWAVVRNTSKV